MLLQHDCAHRQDCCPLLGCWVHLNLLQSTPNLGLPWRLLPVLQMKGKKFRPLVSMCPQEAWRHWPPPP